MQERVRGSRYDALVDETVTALRARYGASLLVHWEDFAAGNAFRLLAKYQAQVACACQIWHHVVVLFVGPGDMPLCSHGLCPGSPS
jgi:hypothetical protein